jgi:phytoene dehydrogenase-like protein
LKKFGILGSGISGLVAANYLINKDKDYSVTIIEQGNSVGGRVQSALFEGLTYDIGATLFTPYLINFMKKKLNIEISTVDIFWDIIMTDRTKPLRVDRTEVSFRDLKNLTGSGRIGLFPYLIRLLREIFNMNQISIKEFFDNLKLDEELKVYLSAGVINSGLSTDEAEASVLKLMKYAHHFKYPIGGTGSIPQKLSENFKTKGGKILLNSRVKNINDISNSVLITLDNGETLEFDKVISCIGVSEQLYYFCAKLSKLLHFLLIYLNSGVELFKSQYTPKFNVLLNFSSSISYGSLFDHIKKMGQARDHQMCKNPRKS